MAPADEHLLRRLAINDEAALASMLCPLSDAEVTYLDARPLMLVRLAAVIALNCNEATYSWGVTNARAVGATEAELVGVLGAVAPIVGLAHLSSAAANLARALGYDIDRALE